jgi:hypothetical protein
MVEAFGKESGAKTIRRRPAKLFQDENQTLLEKQYRVLSRQV